MAEPRFSDNQQELFRQATADLLLEARRAAGWSRRELEKRLGWQVLPGRGHLEEWILSGATPVDCCLIAVQAFQAAGLEQGASEDDAGAREGTSELAGETREGDVPLDEDPRPPPSWPSEYPRPASPATALYDRSPSLVYELRRKTRVVELALANLLDLVEREPSLSDEITQTLLAFLVEDLKRRLGSEDKAFRLTAPVWDHLQGKDPNGPSPQEGGAGDGAE